MDGWIACRNESNKRMRDVIREEFLSFTSICLRKAIENGLFEILT